MKPVKLFFLIFLSCTFMCNVYAQPQYYLEQNSGVNTSLSSVCMLAPFFPNQVWVCGDNGTVLKSTNEGNNWISVGMNGIPSNVNLININCGAFDTALTAGNIGATTYLYRTTNGGTSWLPVFTQTNGKINAIWMKSALQGFMVGDAVGGRWSLWKTTNGGVSWDSTGLFLSQVGSETGWYNSLEILNNNIWFGTNNSRIYQSTNYGTSWSILSTAPEVNSSAFWHLKFDSTFAFLGGTNLYKTTNGGINWTLLNCPGTGNFKGFCVGPLGVSNSSEWYGPAFTVRGNSQVYLSWQGNGGQFVLDYTAPSGNYNHIAYSNATDFYSAPPYSWAVRSNGGITKIFTGRGGAVRRISSEIPQTYRLEQNYPNPFNPVTRIKFDIPAEVHDNVSLRIYDILGREVATLVNEQLKPGTYEVEWDALNFPSGVYYYKLTAGEASTPLSMTETKKMVLIK